MLRERLRACAGGLLLAVPLLVLPGLTDSFSAPKRLLVGLGGGLLLLASASGRARAGNAWVCFAVAWVLAALSGTGARELLLGLCALGVAAWPPRFSSRWMHAWLLTLALVAAVTLAQALGFDPFRTGDALDVGKWRHYGTLGNPNRVGWLLSLGLVVAQGPWLAPLAMGVLLTLSRGAMLATVVTLAVVGRRREALGLAAVFVAVSGLVAWLGPDEWSRWLVNSKSIAGRWEHWGQAWRLFLEHPWLGIGVGRFTELSTQGVEYVHQEYLGMLVEQGALGAGACFAGLALALRQGARTAPSWALAVVVQVLVLSLFDFPLREPSMLLAFVAALVTMLPRARERGPLVAAPVAQLVGAVVAVAFGLQLAVEVSRLVPRGEPEGNRVLRDVFRKH